MQLIEIIVIITALLIVLSVFGMWLYKKINHKPMGECACCHQRMKKELEKMRRELKKN